MNIDSLWTRQSRWIYPHKHMDRDNRKIISANTFFNTFNVLLFFLFDFGSFAEANGMQHTHSHSFYYIYHFKSKHFSQYPILFGLTFFMMDKKNRDYLCVVSVFFLLLICLMPIPFEGKNRLTINFNLYR